MEASSAPIYADHKPVISTQPVYMAPDTTPPVHILQQEQQTAMQCSCQDTKERGRNVPEAARKGGKLSESQSSKDGSPFNSSLLAGVLTPVQEEAPFLSSSYVGNQAQSPAPIPDDSHETEDLPTCGMAVAVCDSDECQQTAAASPASDATELKPGSSSPIHPHVDTLDDDDAAALGLLLLQSQPASSVLSHGGALQYTDGPLVLVPDTKRLKHQQPGHISCQSSQQPPSGGLVSDLSGSANQQQAIQQHSLASTVVSQNKQRAALAWVQAAKQPRKQGHRLTRETTSLGSTSRFAAAQHAHQPPQLLPAGAARQLDAKAAAAVAAVKVAALQADTADLLLDKVYSALQQLPVSTTLGEQRAPEQMLAAAAAPWYPAGGTKPPFLVKRQGRMVPRKTFALPSAAADLVSGAAEMDSPVGSKRKAMSLLQVVQECVQQYRAADSAAAAASQAAVDRQTGPLPATDISPVKQVTDAEMERKMQLQQRRQQSAGNSQSPAPSATPDHPTQHDSGAKLDRVPPQGAAAVLVHTAEAERRLQPRRKRKLPSKLDDTLSTDCALQIISGRGPKIAPSQQHRDVLQLLKEQLTSASMAMQQPAPAHAAQLSRSASQADVGSTQQQRPGWQHHAWWVGNPMTQREIHRQWWAWAEQEQQKLEQQEMEELLARYAQPQRQASSGADSSSQPQQQQDAKAQQELLQPAALGLAVWSCLARQPEAAVATAEAAIQGGAPAALQQLTSMTAAVQQAASGSGAAKNPALAPFLLPRKVLCQCQETAADKLQVDQGARLSVTEASAAAAKAAGSSDDNQQTALAAATAVDDAPVAVDAAAPAAEPAELPGEKQETAAAVASGKRPSAEGMSTTAAVRRASKVLPPPLSVVGLSRADIIAAKRARLEQQLQAACVTPKPADPPGISSIYTLEAMLPSKQEAHQQHSTASARHSSPDLVMVDMPEGQQEYNNASVLPGSPDAEPAQPHKSSAPQRKQSRKPRKARGPPPMLKNQQQIEQLMIQQQNQQRIGAILQKAQQQQQQKQEVQELLDRVAEQRKQRLQQVRMQQHQAKVQALMQRIVAQQQPQQQQQKAQQQPQHGSQDACASQQQPGLLRVVLQQPQPEPHSQLPSPQGAPQQGQCLPGDTTLKLQPGQPSKILQSSPKDRSDNQQQHVDDGPTSAAQTGTADEQQQHQRMSVPSTHKPVINLSAATAVAASSNKKVQQQQQAPVRPPVPATHAQMPADARPPQVSAPMQQQQVVKPAQQQVSGVSMSLQQQQLTQQTQANQQLHAFMRPAMPMQQAGQQQVLPSLPMGQVSRLRSVSPQPQAVASQHVTPQLRPVTQLQLPSSAPAQADHVTAATATSTQSRGVQAGVAAPAAAAKPAARISAVAASRARLLAALGGDDDAPAAAATASTAAVQYSTAPAAAMMVSSGQLSTSCAMAPAASLPLSMPAAMRPGTAMMPMQAPAAMAGGSRGLMYVPVMHMPVAFVPATAAYMQRLPGRHQLMMPGNVPGAPMMVAAEPNRVQQ